MSVTYNVNLKNDRMQAIVNRVDAQPSPGKIEIYNGSTILADETLSKPSGTVANGILTFSNLPITTTVLATGTATTARLLDGSGNVVADGYTVGTSGTNLVVNTTSLVQNQNLTINSFTITSGN